eukprot:CAMPEP_0197833898 /NCGR_PEP_ID=MMETSP1437-20131217/20495_1 /TAXON_ID=49252 ORGANISM="Eucampia antarctica, Strain CCMP1452" /NCGR_SAMPLE_ID=MMETSP1437 /ASSEMBLY_ACC=CAM_ASM_001096 /LENGTH=46 /DNA_ID= /DNA_START= /DNA_END= /DNA_ORIENTATION=
MTSKMEIHLPINRLSKNGMEAHTFEDLKTGNLISIAQLCDDDCKVT